MPITPAVSSELEQGSVNQQIKDKKKRLLLKRLLAIISCILLSSIRFVL